MFGSTVNTMTGSMFVFGLLLLFIPGVRSIGIGCIILAVAFLVPACWGVRDEEEEENT